MQTIYVATGNLSKLSDFTRFIRWIDSKYDVLQVPDYVSVVEDGITPGENSRLKVLPYVGKYTYPVLANDSALYFDKKVVEIQDPLKIKRNALKGLDESSLTQEEMGQMMLTYYQQIAQKYGGSIDCTMKASFCLLLPDGRIFEAEGQSDYQLINRQVSKFDIFHPLNSLKKSVITDKFTCDQTESDEQLDRASSIDALRFLLSTI